MIKQRAFLLIFFNLLIFLNTTIIKAQTNDYNTQEIRENIPSYINEWIDSELEKASIKEIQDFCADSFFNSTPARLIGYIRRYDPDCGVESGLIHGVNHLTNEQHPVVVRIHPDGRFEAELDMQHPTSTFFDLFQYQFPFYIEPGHTLAMFFDYEDFYNKEYAFSVNILEKISYRGPLARINTELNLFQPESYGRYQMSDKVVSSSPASFKEEQDRIHERNGALLKQLIKEKEISHQAAHLLSLDEQLEYTSCVLWYLTMKDYMFEEDITGNEFIHASLPDGFMDFLYEIPLTDPYLYATKSFYIFINRLEYSYPFCGWHLRMLNVLYWQDTYEKSFFRYLKEEGVVFDDDQTAFIEWADNVNKNLFNILQKTPQEELFKKHMIFAQLAYKQYKQHWVDWDKYSLDTNYTRMEKKKEWELIDYILTKDFRFEPSIIFENIRLRSFMMGGNSLFEEHTLQESEELLEELLAHLTHPVLRKEAEGMFRQYSPEKEATELPEGKGKEILNRIIEKHRGKILFIDFWATWCGPCVGTIKDNKEVRKKYEGHPDFDLLFITDETSPLSKYEEFMQEQELTHSYRLTSSEFSYIKEMLKFNGLPKYIVIDKEGKLLNDNFSMHHLETTLQRIPGIRLEE